jgi:hypothetical protein
MSSLPRRTIILLVVILPLQGCASWGPTSVDPRQLIEEQRPSTIRVHSLSGDRRVADKPEIENDSIMTRSERCRASVAAGGRVVCESSRTAVAALSDIDFIEVEQFDAMRTAGGVVLAPIGLIALMFMVLVATCDESDGWGPC